MSTFKLNSLGLAVIIAMTAFQVNADDAVIKSKFCALFVPQIIFSVIGNGRSLQALYWSDYVNQQAKQKGYQILEEGVVAQEKYQADFLNLQEAMHPGDFALLTEISANTDKYECQFTAKMTREEAQGSDLIPVEFFNQTDHEYKPQDPNPIEMQLYDSGAQNPWIKTSLPGCGTAIIAVIQKLPKCVLTK